MESNFNAMFGVQGCSWFWLDVLVLACNDDRGAISGGGAAARHP